MPRYYVDLDNNRLVTGPQSTQLAPTPKLYQGDKPTVDVELLTRTNSVLGYYTSAASAINVRVGTLGGSAVASALTLSTVTLSATATATAGIAFASAVTATATAALSTPVSGSITATFSQVQLPVITPILKQNRVIGIEAPTCGLYFGSTPSVFFSEPDIFDKNAFITNAVGVLTMDSETIYTPPDNENWPGVMSIVAFLDVYQASGGSNAGYGSIIARSGAVITVSTTTNLTTTLTLSGVDVLGGTVTARATNGASDGVSLYGHVIVRAPSKRAQLSSTVSGGLLGLTITNIGDNYSSPPDVFVVPQPQDYTLGAHKTVTSATISGRTTVVTSTAHGLSAGSLIYVEALDYQDSYTGGKYFGVKGIWPLVSVTTDSMTFRIDRFASETIKTLSLVTAGAKIYPVNLCRTLQSATVACAGSGYAENSSIPFSISSDSCGGLAATGVVSVSAAGVLASARVTCSGSGFTTSSTVVTFAAYKKVAAITVTCAGAGYVAAPSVTLDDSAYVPTAPGAARAQITPAVNADGTIRLVLASGGYGYTSAPTITLSAPTASWPVTGFTVTCAGAGYTEAPSVSLAGGGGSGAAASAILTNGSVTSISLTSGGSGYTSAPTVTLSAPPASVYYSKQIDLSGASVITLLGGNSSASAYLQVEEKRGSDTTVLAQLPVTVVARVS
jgi:hypothetical protein